MTNIRRRQFLLGAGALLAPPLARSEQSAGIRRLGVLVNSPPAPPEYQKKFGVYKLFSTRLSTLGWILGKNLVIESKYSDGISERLPELVAALVRARVDVIIPTSTASAVAAARGTKTVPIVLVGSSAYPIECGLIKSYARPGTNVTGVAWFQSIEVHAKLAQFVREIVPSATRLAWIVFSPDLVTVAGGEFSPKPYYAKVAESLGFQFEYHDCREPSDIDRAFAALRKWGAHAVIVEPAVMPFMEAERLADQSKRARLPIFSGMTVNALLGGLLAYAPNVKELQEEAMTYVDRIFRGANPAVLPVVMPNRLTLTVNLQTARALGITISPSILLRADKVIE